jgi:hypothetical protein
MKRFFWVVVLVLIIAGCSNIPRTENMIPAVTREPGPRYAAPLVLGEVKASPTAETLGLGAEGIGIGSFVRALQEAIEKSNLFAATGPEEDTYFLDVILIGQDLPTFGVNFTVGLGVRYTLRKGKGGTPVWEKDIYSDHTETCCGSPIGSTRARKASEGAARNNIRKLVEELSSLDLD